MPQESLPSHNNTGTQIDINFEQAAKDALEREQADVALKYGVKDKTTIFKDTKGVWKYYGTYESVQQAYEDREALYEKDKKDPYQHN